MSKSTRRAKSLFGGVRAFSQRLRTLVKQPIFIFITIFGHATIATGTIAFYYFEKGINPKVNSLFDTLYWAIATITTVGYGDAYPITVGGKIVSMAMMILGSIFLWSYTALFAGGLVTPEIRMIEKEVRNLEEEFHGGEIDAKNDEKTNRELLHEIQALRKEIKANMSNK